jgi:small subunit ribosomal protein S17
MTTSERNARRTLIGIVTSAKTPKTITVEVQRTFKHPKYGKFLRRRKRYLVHDEEGKAQVGDEVEIASTRPLSRRKRWRLLGTIAKSRLAGIEYVDTAAQVMADIQGDDRPEERS